MRIDMHAHILPQHWPDFSQRFNDPRWPTIVHTDGRHRMFKDGKFFREIAANSWEPELRIAQYAAHGIDVQVVSTVPVMFCYWADGDKALQLHQHLNDHKAEVVRAHRQHYCALGTVPLQTPELAIAELRRCVVELGLAGVQIGSHVGTWNLDAPELFPFFAEAAALDAAILVHPWDMMGAESMPKYWLPWLVGMPAEQSRAACSLILGNVLGRLPSLRIAMAHGGGSFPFTIGRIAHGHAMRPDLVAVDYAPSPREGLAQLYFDTCVHDAQALRYLVELIGCDKLMLGTDFPFPLGEQAPGALIQGLELSAAQRANLYAGSALRWLGSRATAHLHT